MIFKDKTFVDEEDIEKVVVFFYPTLYNTSIRANIMHQLNTHENRSLAHAHIQVPQFYELIASTRKILVFINKATNLVAKDRSAPPVCFLPTLDLVLLEYYPVKHVQFNGHAYSHYKQQHMHMYICIRSTSASVQ